MSSTDIPPPPPAWFVLAIAIVPKIPGLLSMIGSMFITRAIHKKWRRDRGSLSMTSRIMLNISIADILVSFFRDLLGTWMFPSYMPSAYVAFASGSDATCAAQHFIGNLVWSATNTASAFLAVSCKFHVLHVCTILLHRANSF